MGPLAGGFLADFFSIHQIVIGAQWTDPSRDIHFPSLYLGPFTLLFCLAFIIGLVTLNSLTTIREEGEASRQEVLAELLASTRLITRTIGSAPALRLLGRFAHLLFVQRHDRKSG